MKELITPNMGFTGLTIAVTTFCIVVMVIALGMATIIIVNASEDQRIPWRSRIGLVACTGLYLMCSIGSMAFATYIGVRSWSFLQIMLLSIGSYGMLAGAMLYTRLKKKTLKVNLSPRDWINLGAYIAPGYVMVIIGMAI